jgi:TctA family transporter
MMEHYLRQSMMASNGNLLYFLNSNITATLLSMAALLTIGNIGFALLRQKNKKI